jgi:hypothetical protein
MMKIMDRVKSRSADEKEINMLLELSKEIEG